MNKDHPTKPEDLLARGVLDLLKRDVNQLIAAGEMIQASALLKTLQKHRSKRQK